MFRNLYVYFSLCLLWGYLAGELESYFGLATCSVCLGAGIPFMIIFNPVKYFLRKNNE